VPPPLVVTARLDAAAFARLDALRRAYFPPERNHLPAHVTLFHQLPGEEERAVRGDLEDACAGVAPLAATVTGPVLLGRGVAFRLDAPGLERLRAGLAARWTQWLTRQDAGRLRPHVTVQNKVEPAAAKALHAQLAAAHEPYPAQVEGLLLWRYLGGPWEAVGEVPLTG
jgi:hypothetical protein